MIAIIADLQGMSHWRYYALRELLAEQTTQDVSVKILICKKAQHPGL
jgi:hypothetical protein